MLTDLARRYRVMANISRDSSRAEIKAAYRKILLAVHPDKGGKKENAQRLQEEDVRDSEKKRDTVAVFKRRVAAACQRYPSKLALVPSMAGRMAKCVKLRGANIGK